MQPSTNLLALFTSAALAAVHTVEVGDGGLTFDPQTLTATSGDIVVFNLYATHDVVQGAFDSPCTPSDNGLYSGAYSETDGGKKKFVVNITSDDPIYYYCSVQRHCQSGMVGGINIPDGDEGIDAYSDASGDVQQAETPDGSTNGGQLLEDEQVSSLTASATGSASPSASASASGSDSPSSAPANPTGSATSSMAPTGSGTAASGSPAASSTGAAVGGQVPALGAALLGFAAWVL